MKTKVELITNVVTYNNGEIKSKAKYTILHSRGFGRHYIDFMSIDKVLEFTKQEVEEIKAKYINACMSDNQEHEGVKRSIWGDIYIAWCSFFLELRENIQKDNIITWENANIQFHGEKAFLNDVLLDYEATKLEL